MPGIEEKENTWRYRVRDPGLFEDFRTKETNGGVSFVFGKYKGKDEWAIQSIVFHKDKFPTRDSVSKWLHDHTVKEQAQAFDEAKNASSYDLILAYEAALEKPCLVGLSKYVPELESRGYNPVDGKQVLLTSNPVEEEPDQDKRAVLYAIGKKEEGHKTKPAKYKDIPDSQFADPTNYKYPVDCAHVVSAWQYIHHDANQSAGGYSDAEWSAMKTKIKGAMKRCGHEVNAQAMDLVARLLQGLAEDFS